MNKSESEMIWAVAERPEAQVPPLAGEMLNGAAKRGVQRGGGHTLKVQSLLFWALIIHCSLFISCRPSPQYQDHYNIPGQAWRSDYQPEFKFEVADTTAAYQLFLLIRHTDAYPFSNIWLTMESRGPNDSAFRKLRVEVPLAAASGQWLGRGMGELWEQRVPINSLQMPAFFPHKGLYTVRLAQDMRRDPLPEILTVGFRVEKLPPFKRGS